MAWKRRHEVTAFDKVWIDGLSVKLMRNGVANNTLKWIQSYLFNRRARVSIDQLSSRKILLRQGVPQSGVLPATLFLVFINDLVSELPRGVKAALYADDYPPETWTHVYTDCSATKATTDGGAGIIIQYPSGATQTASSATGKHCTNYKAETEAPKQAATLVKALEPCSPTVITDYRY